MQWIVVLVMISACLAGWVRPPIADPGRGGAGAPTDVVGPRSTTEDHYRLTERQNSYRWGG